MILKIDNTNASVVPLRLPVRGRTALQSPAVGADEAAVEIAANAQASPGQGEDSFDVAKVNAIKEEIRSGRYVIDPERIADGILASVRELIPPRRG